MDPYELDDVALAAVLAEQPPYRVRQVRAWLRRGVDDPHEMTDLPADLRRHLRRVFDSPAQLVRHTTADGGTTHKLLLRLGHGRAAELVESVLMLYPRAEGRAGGRATVCVSTQAGCAMGCVFCATGQVGFRRQLRAGEVVRQVATAQRALRTGTITAAGAPEHVTNVVFMGMGEPLANLAATVEAVRWLTGDRFGLSARAVTVSTVGVVPGIRALADLGLPLTLAVSLHAPDDALRDKLVPLNRRYPLGQLLDACAHYHAATRRRLTFEYVLIDGVNAAAAQARALAALVGGIGAHVNLIPYNPTPALRWQPPPVDAQRAFADVLATAGLQVTVRTNRGTAIDAACGQLYADYALGSGATLPVAAAT